MLRRKGYFGPLHILPMLAPPIRIVSLTLNLLVTGTGILLWHMLTFPFPSKLGSLAQSTHRYSLTEIRCTEVQLIYNAFCSVMVYQLLP